MLIVLHYTAVLRKVVLQTGKSFRGNVESYYGCNGGFKDCLIELQGVSAWWKETAQTHVCIRSFLFLVAESS